MEKLGGYKPEVKARIETGERLASKKEGGGEHLSVYGRFREEIG